MILLSVALHGEGINMEDFQISKKTKPRSDELTPQEELEALKARAQASEDALMFLMENGGM